MHILLSNDDGIQAEGLGILREGLQEVRPDWKITTVAPAGEQSAMSHALTLSRPLRINRVGEREYAIDGTPTDCVLMAVDALLEDDRPDVVISGINHGPNMGEDVHYSGTVAAAFEGRLLGLPRRVAILLFPQQLHCVSIVEKESVRSGRPIIDARGLNWNAGAPMRCFGSGSRAPR